ncbi:MAG TPA: type II toxin-antitoxin system ParD family antitoxin [Parvularcula sp.]|nr:type II toxin-antitoxin system ParD family antitoxin [Parvularcula sp.]
MATTSFTLGEHWEAFIKAQVESGRFATASEVLRESLRLMERREAKIAALRAAIIEGEESGPAEPLDLEEIKRAARAELERRKNSA